MWGHELIKILDILGYSVLLLINVITLIVLLPDPAHKFFSPLMLHVNKIGPHLRYQPLGLLREIMSARINQDTT